MYTRKSSMYTYTGWRRLIGSPKLHIIFHKRAAKYRSLLRKMTYKDKGSYESSPPCIRPLSSSTSISLCRLCIHVFIHMYINTHIHKRKRSIYIHIRPAYRQPLYAMYTSAHTYRYSHTCTYEKAARIWPERILAAPVVTLYMAIYTSIHIDVYTCTRTHSFDIQQHTSIHPIEKDICCPCRQPLHRYLCLYSYTCIYMYAHTFIRYTATHLHTSDSKECCSTHRRSLYCFSQVYACTADCR